MVTREYPPFIVGGVATHTFLLTKHLRKLGVEVTTVSFGEPKFSTDNEIFLSPSSSLLEEARNRTKLHKDLMLIMDIRHITSYVRKLLQQRKFDIVHVQEPYIGGLITYSGKKVTSIHDTGMGEVKSILEYSVHIDLQALKKIMFYITLGYFMEYSSILSSKIIITPSYACKQELVHMYKVKPEKIIVVHNGIEPPENVPSKEEARKILGLPRDKVVILNVGRHIPRKRIDVLLNAVRNLDKKLHEEILVILVGSGPETPFLRAFAERNGLSHIVKFVGRVSDVWLYYSASDIFVLSSNEESAPMVLLEAAIMGNVIVTTRVGDYAFIMKNGVDGIIFEPGDVNALASILERLVTDRNLRLTLSRNAKLFASKFTAEEMARKTLSIYQKLVN